MFLLVDGWQRDQQPPRGRRPSPSTADEGRTGEPFPRRPPARSSRAAQLPPHGGHAAGARAGARRDRTVETDVVIARDQHRWAAICGGSSSSSIATPIDKNKPFVLFERADHVYIAQAGLTGGKLPNHRTRFTAGRAELQADRGSGRARRAACRRRAGGRRRRHARSIAFAAAAISRRRASRSRTRDASRCSPTRISSSCATASRRRAIRRCCRRSPASRVYTEKDKFQKITFEDIEKNKATYPKNSDDGWIAIIQHYFLSAWLPKNGDAARVLRPPAGQRLNAAGVIVPVGRSRPAQAATATVPLYAGPAGTRTKLAATRARAGPGRRLRVADGDCGAALLGAASGCTSGSATGAWRSSF